MKRFLFAVILLLGLSAVFVSCNKDNTNNYSNLIVGTWELVKSEHYKDGSLVRIEDGNGYLVTFTKEGYYYTNDMKSIQVEYSISGNKLMVHAGVVLSFTILKLTNSEMQLEGLDDLIDTEHNSKAVGFYKRVK